MLAPDLPGFVNFVIQFMIQMSKVHCAICLDIILVLCDHNGKCDMYVSTSTVPISVQ